MFAVRTGCFAFLLLAFIFSILDRKQLKWQRLFYFIDATIDARDID